MTYSVELMEPDTALMEADETTGRVSCPECGKLTSPRGLTRHRKSAHGTTSPKAGSNRRRVRGLDHATSEGLTTLAGKLFFGLTLMWAWWALRRAKVPDPNGEIADSLAFTDDEAVSVGRPVARFFASTEPGRRLAPIIVENSDMLDAGFALFDWHRRTSKLWDEISSQGWAQTQTPTQPTTTEVSRGSDGQAPQNRNSGGGEGWDWYVPPSPVDVIGESAG
jgi:hypothetical protein